MGEIEHHPGVISVLVQPGSDVIVPGDAMKSLLDHARGCVIICQLLQVPSSVSLPAVASLQLVTLL